MSETDRRRETAPRLTRAPADALKRLRSCELLGADQKVLIEHKGQWYRLSATRNDKLILTK